MGVNPISYTEMWSFFNLEGIKPNPWEIRLITQLDDIAIDQMNKEQEKRQKAMMKKPKPSK